MPQRRRDTAVILPGMVSGAVRRNVIVALVYVVVLLLSVNAVLALL